MRKDEKALSKAHFDQRARTYDVDMAKKFASILYKDALSFARALRPDNILDVGCGTGNILSMIAEENWGTELFGIDISPEMIAVAREKLGDKAQIQEGDSEALPYDDKTFDVIICNASFHHYPNPKAALKEMRRVLKDDGHLIIGDPNPLFIIGFFANIFKKRTNEHKLYTKRAFTNILGECGFIIEEFKKTSRKSCVFRAVKF